MATTSMGINSEKQSGAFAMSSDTSGHWTRSLPPKAFSVATIEATAGDQDRGEQG